MSAAEVWYCLRNFKGPSGDGKGVVDYKYGDPIPRVTDWPTFTSLRNISWITNDRPHDVPGAVENAEPAKVLDINNGDKVETKPAKKKAKSKAKASPKKVAKKKATSKKKTKTVKAKGGPVDCPKCDRSFASSRAMNVHQRFHESDG